MLQSVVIVLRQSNSRVLACFTCGEEEDGFCRVVSTLIFVQVVLKIWAETKIHEVIQYNPQSLACLGNLYLQLTKTTSFNEMVLPNS